MSTADAADARCPACGRAVQAVWHVAVGEAVHGPYDLEQLREAWRTGKVASEHYIHREGWIEWRLASQVEELSSRAHPSAPPAHLPGMRQPNLLAAASGDTSPRSDMLQEVFGAPLTGPVMGHDPFHDESFGEAVQAPAAEREDAARWNDPSAAWDLDNMPALSSLLAPGRTAASAFAVSAAAESQSEVVQVRHAPAPEPAPSEEASLDAPAPQDTVVRSFMARPRVNTPTQPAALQWATQNLSRYVQGRRSGVMVALAVGGVFVSVATVVAWALGGGSGGSDHASAQAPSVAQVAPAVPAVAATDTVTATHALHEAPANAQSAQPSQAQPEMLAQARPLAAADDARPARDSAPRRASVDDDSSTADRAAAARAQRLERRAAAKAARVARLKARWLAKQKQGRRMSAKVAGVSRSGRKARSADAMMEDDAAAASEPSAPKATAASDDSLDALVEGAISGKRRPVKSSAKPEEQPPEVDESLPATPSREAMLGAIGKARAAVSRCEGSGTVTASIHIKGPLGRATRVELEGVSGPARTCVETAIRKTAFPKFQQTDFAVRAPFKLAEG